ncbi:DUF3953 domain-containing protein [Candidatus Pacearchaeota archaeon]|nr:DUF3953 domain-containing protein [Candidatus Pacearchaeota archaeon]
MGLFKNKKKMVAFTYIYYASFIWYISFHWK